MVHCEMFYGMEASSKSDGTVAAPTLFIFAQHGQAVATDRSVGVAGRGQRRGGPLLAAEWFALVARSLETFR